MYLCINHYSHEKCPYQISQGEKMYSLTWKQTLEPWNYTTDLSTELVSYKVHSSIQAFYPFLMISILKNYMQEKETTTSKQC